MGLGGVAIATLPSVIFPKLMFSDRLGGYFISIFVIGKSCFVTTHDIRRPCAPSMLAEQE